jgi:hypothetical protein
MKKKQLLAIVTAVLLVITACSPKVKKEVGTKFINDVVEPKTEQVELGNYSKVIYVSNNSLKGDGSKDNPYTSIDEAVKASEGKTAILVAKDDILRKTIELKNDVHLFGGFNSEDWTRDVAKYPTTINGMGNCRIINAAKNNTIDGFVISSGRVRGNGAAILCKGVSPKISNNLFVHNQAQGPKPWKPKFWHETANDGGAIYCSNGASPIVENNIFAKNTTVNGRGAAFAADGKCKPIIRNNVFFENRAGVDDPMRSSDAGAVSIFNWSDAVIEGNLFVSNTAEAKNDGGAVFIALWSSAKVNNNLFVDNHSGDDAGALFVGGQEHRYGGLPLDPIPPKDQFFVSIKENTFIGNHHGGTNSGAMRFTMESRGEFVNNRLAQNYGVYFQRSEVRIADNTILDNFLFIETKEGLELGTIENNLIWGYYDQEVEAEVKNNNMMQPIEGNGNYSKTPKFVDDQMEIKSIATIFDKPSFTSTAFTNTNLVVNELANRAVNVDGKWAVIKSNRENSITLWGNFAGKVNFNVAPTYTLVNK